ncbi:MAG: hypothetical protein ACW98D_13175 [Promethearchaeota archaeon]
MNGVNQAINNIDEEFKRVRPSPQRIISLLFNLRIDQEGIEISPKDEWCYVSESEFLNIVGDIFNKNPEFYMKYLYRRIRKRVRKLCGIEKLNELEKQIIKKFCLYPGEQILLEFNGAIQFSENPKLRSRGTSIGLTRVGATLYITNNRIIAQGMIKARGGSTSTGWSSCKRIIDTSRQEKCYEYVFPSKNISKLKRKNITGAVNYNIENYGGLHKYKNINIRVSKSPTQQEDINKLMEILSIE